ncbi:MAG: insulinase family protein [Bacteroidales bacterium]|nr:insulinase family protein [Bacteroidales bacterium]
MKRLVIIIAALFAAAVAFGQNPLPNDPEVKVGQLENGLTYYIRHNDQPAQRAEFYLATNAGAYQEADDQDGLAHFLEHMCFNGTKHFPGKALLEYLQSIGAEFGRNINASTGFEQTQYMLNNIPVVRESIIDSCLLILHDYSHYVTCNPEEIDAERGVILEEKRQRSDASWRMFEKQLPYLYGDTHYARRTLIGGEEQLKTFKYESLTNFYTKWYQPHNQAVIVVGDVDVDKVEQKIKELFGSIPAGEVAVKEEPALPFNAEPVVGIITDPEAQNSRIDILWKHDPIPVEFQNTDGAYMNDLLLMIISNIMSERFNDIAAAPNAPFFAAGFFTNDLCNACEAYNAAVLFKDGASVEAFTALMTEIEKMKRFGFNEGEVQRVKDDLISRCEKAVEAASTRKNAELVRPLLSNFFDNEAYLTPETELQIVQAVCAQVNAQVLNQVAAQLLPSENIIITYQGPEKEGLANPTEAELLGVLAAVAEAEIEANAEENFNEPFLNADALKGSAVKNESKNQFGATEWTLKNGIKVVVLPTQYKKDQVLFNIELMGGKNAVATEDLTSFEENIWGLFIQNSGISKFSGTQVPKMVAGKSLSVTPYISNTRHGVQGQSTPKDLETALQIAYLYFADPRFDQNEFEPGIQQIKALLPNILSNPDFQFQQELNKILYDNNPRVVGLDESVVEKANLATIEKVYRELFKNAGGATLTIVGNVDLETLKPMVEKYIGSIAKNKKAREINKANLINFAKGEVKETVELAMATPKSTVLQVYSAYMPIDTKTEVALEVANYVIDMIYTKTIREDEGGTYGVGTAMAGQRSPIERAVIQISFDTNPEAAPKLIELAVKGLNDLAQNGPTAEQMSKAVENLKKNIPESRISNSYWMNTLDNWYEFGINSDKEYEAAVNSVTAEDVKAVLQAILAQNNLVQIVSAPKN